MKPRHFSSSRLVMMQNSSRYTSVFLYRKITRINRENSAGNLTFPVHKHLPLQRKITQIIRETFGDNLMIQNSCWYTSLFLYRNINQIIRENSVQNSSRIHQCMSSYTEEYYPNNNGTFCCQPDDA